MIKKNFLYGLLSFIALAVVLGTWSYSRAEGGVITACVKSNGLVYVIGEGFKQSDCLASDQLLSWSIQGPKGEKGDKGDKGDQGEPGLQGPKGDTGGVRMTDVNGADLGIFLGMVNDPEYTGVVRLFLPTINRWIPINGTSGQYAFNSQEAANMVHFSEPNCTGQAYIASLLGTQSVDRIVNTSALDGSQPWNDRFFKVDDPKLAPDPKLLRSRLFNAGCRDIGFVYQHAATASEVNLPFTLPVTTPILMRAN